ncbi:hypothetical protein M9458_035528, partial [Cirrhinus mrigala]
MIKVTRRCLRALDMWKKPWRSRVATLPMVCGAVAIFRGWFSDLISLLSGSSWEIPVRRDLLSQAGGTILHPRPKVVGGRPFALLPFGSQTSRRLIVCVQLEHWT